MSPTWAPECPPDAAVLQLPNVDRDPIPRWSFGCVTLIGDAAHPMQPVGAQAGSQAVVDGRVLAASLIAVRDPFGFRRAIGPDAIQRDVVGVAGRPLVIQRAEERQIRLRDRTFPAQKDKHPCDFTGLGLQRMNVAGGIIPFIGWCQRLKASNPVMTLRRKSRIG